MSNELNDVAAGMFNASMGIGEAIGPVISSIVNKQLGFSASQDLVGAILSVFSIAYFLACGGPFMFTQRKEENHLENAIDGAHMLGGSAFDSETSGGPFTASG